MKHLSRFAAIPFGFVVIAFAIANRGPVEVSLDPLPYARDVPLYMVAMGGLAIGFAAGAVAAWLAGHSARRGLRLGRARIASLEGEISRLRAVTPEKAPLESPASPQTELARLPADAA